MPAVINTNLLSLNAQRNASSAQSSLATSMQRLSSGLRVNSARDDAAGLAIAERMNSQVKGMNVAIRNANDGISLSQTAEGALGKVNDMLQRMRELAVQSANGTNNTDDRTALNNEFTQLQSEITRLSTNTTFNGQAVLTNTTSFNFQVGANATANDTITISGQNMLGTTTAVGKNDGALAEVANTTNTDISNVGAAGTGATFDAYTGTGTKGALDSIAKIDQAIAQVNVARSTFGAAQNRFDAVIESLGTAVENQSAARSRIMDADYAMETANLSRAQILQQAGTAMIAQANQQPQQVLSLLR
ncbi:MULTISPECIES: flagellin N-terminal helical domain-containing protein [unclassified Roseateles]|uniref:flagellin N-terminal helical domain-containing protein n=1 Tax=Pelomonas sp. Root1237 TaxID=1736434 RepID=UPI0006FDECB5|nr:flagellin [Pelomonas sp. Root1237]KQV89616.1 flagellin [Pelomonas sp. Root1237]